MNLSYRGFPERRFIDIDFEGRTIQVSKQWSNKSGFGPTKTQKIRVVPISEDLLMFLKELKLREGSKGEFVKVPTGDLGAKVIQLKWT